MRHRMPIGAVAPISGCSRSSKVTPSEFDALYERLEKVPTSWLLTVAGRSQGHATRPAPRAGDRPQNKGRTPTYAIAVAWKFDR